MTIYKYYAVFNKADEEDCYSVMFPDLENVFTQGKTLAECLINAEDVLGLMLSDYELERMVIPDASPAQKIEVPEGASLVLIETDTIEYITTFD